MATPRDGSNVFGSTGTTSAVEGPLASVTQNGNGTALLIRGGGTTVLDVKNGTGASVLKVGSTPPTVSGAKGSNAALGSLLTALVGMGLITDTTTT